MVPQNIQGLIPGICVTLYGRRDLADVIKLMIFAGEGGILGYLGGP